MHYMITLYLFLREKSEAKLFEAKKEIISDVREFFSSPPPGSWVVAPVSGLTVGPF